MGKYSQNSQAVRLLTGGAGGAPEAQAAGRPAGFDQLGQQFGAQQFEGVPIAKEAGFVDRHGLGDGALEGQVSALFEALHQFIHAVHAPVAHQLVEAALEKVVAGGVQLVLGEPQNKLAQKAVVGAGVWFHG
jgi:hypothetical protein